MEYNKENTDRLSLPCKVDKLLLVIVDILIVLLNFGVLQACFMVMFYLAK